jgi:hypothetical protein
MLLAKIHNQGTFEKYGVHHHCAGIYEYHLEILTGGDDQAKRGLFEAGYYG